MKNEFDKIESRIRENAEMINVPKELEPENIAVMLKEEKAGKALNKAKRGKSRVGLRFAAGATAFALAVGGIYYANSAGLFSSDPLKDEQSISILDSINASSEEILAPKKSYDDIYGTLKIAYDNAYGTDETKNSGGYFSWLFGGFSKKDTANTNNEVELEILTDDMYQPLPEVSEESNGELNEYGKGDAEDDYSKTLTQVEGVDEADIVKTNGEDIFYISDNTLYRIPVENGIFGEIEVIASSEDTNGVFADMYLYDDKLVTVSVVYEASYSDDYGEIYYDDICWNYQALETIVDIYGISDDSKSTYSQTGDYVSSRMIDNMLYLVTDDDSKSLAAIDPKEKSTFVPSYYCNGDENYVPAEDIVVTEDIVNLSYGVVCSIDVNAPEEPVSIKAIAGFTGEVYCSGSNIYLAGSRYDYAANTANTYITRIGIDSGILSTEATAVINGTVLNQYSMDEYNGYFRVASTYYTYYSETADEANAVYIYDMDMQLVGKCEDLGLDETIRSVRFMGDIGYVVTFMQTDPLYAIDLSDPANPTVLDEFKISGYSTFLHPFGDGLMYSFGVEADEETGWTTGIKVTMYDTSDPENLQVLDSYVWENVESYDNGIEWYYYDSTAVYDEKALYIDVENGLLGIPFYESGYVESYTDDYVYESYKTGYYMLRFENGEFKVAAQYTKELDSDYYYCVDFNRGVRIADYFYMLGNYSLASMDLNDMSIVDEVECYGAKG